MLYRKWRNRVKGRDWYDFVWFIKKGIPLNLNHLSIRMAQSGDWEMGKTLNGKDFARVLSHAIMDLDVKQAKNDVLPFIKNQNEVDVWSKEFFSALLSEIILQ